uniref:Selenoprotein M n=1 Tax=Oncorhynchus kisutch TaxID=8019 RepID=A0A8C7F2S3_ONCKI
MYSIIVILQLMKCSEISLPAQQNRVTLTINSSTPQVKAFVTQDIPLYHNLVMKHIPGADPELVLLNHYYEELDRIALSDMTRSEINELLEKLGFYKKAQPEDQVPEEFRFSPAKDSPFKATPSSSAPADNASSDSDAEAKHSDL